MSEKENTKGTVSEENAELSEEEKQKLLEKFDKESKTRSFASPVMVKAYKAFAILVTLYHLIFSPIPFHIQLRRGKFQCFRQGSIRLFSHLIVALFTQKYFRMKASAQ